MPSDYAFASSVEAVNQRTEDSKGVIRSRKSEDRRYKGVIRSRKSEDRK
jgi:hypothetical protein